MKKNLILIGGGGHCKSVIDVVEQEGKYDIKGIIDPDSTSNSVLNYNVLGGDDLIPSLIGANTFFLITVGQIKSAGIRIKIGQLLDDVGAQLATVISPLAYVSQHAIVKEVSIIMHKAIINAGAEIGKHCIINTLANVEHDAKVGDFCHISTAAILNGEVVVRKCSFVGSNATISNNVILEENSVISAGKFVKK
jgi:sugar O-acyltransferase (sialic acid O-acetyltransferase NeuD family)